MVNNKRYDCLKAKDKKTKNMFLKLPSQLYSKNENPQNKSLEKQILDGKHILSDEFEVMPFVVIDQTNNKVQCRCLLTFYKNDNNAYLGFFEAFDNQDAVNKMFACVEKYVYGKGKKKIIGPVDCSMYINYRFKTDRFDKTYTGEPYNLPYYAELWEKYGFDVYETYHSNQLRKVEKNDVDERLSRLIERFEKRGITFTQPNHKNINQVIEQVYELMMETYSGFSMYKNISKEKFMKCFGGIKHILNYDMVKIAYKEGKLKAFAVCVPNYGYLTRGKSTLIKLLKLKKIKNKPSEYVVLYVGADSGAAGLGGALVHQVRNELFKNRCTSIGALIKEGNITGEMYKDLYTDKFTYKLFSKEVRK